MLFKNSILPIPEIRFMAGEGDGGKDPKDPKEGEKTDLEKIMESITGIKTSVDTELKSLKAQLEELKSLKGKKTDEDEDEIDDEDEVPKKKNSKKQKENDDEEKLTSKSIARIVAKTAAETYRKEKESDEKKNVLSMLLELSEDEKKMLSVIPNYQNLAAADLKGVIELIKKKENVSPGVGGSNPKQNTGAFDYKKFKEKIKTYI